jgi:glycine oxidase
MADVAIVGGGVIGCAAAYYLTKAGARVTLLERDGLAGGASGAAAGMLVPPQEAAPSGPFRDLCRASADSYPSLVEALQDETGIDVQYLASGILLPARTEQRAQVLRTVARWRLVLGIDLEWVDGGPLRELEPALGDGVLGAAYSPQGHHVNPGHLTQALARAAASRGATLRQGTAVAGFPRRGSRVVAVRTSDGDTIAADCVVLAAGPWTRRLGRKLGVDVPTRPMRGQMLAYRSTAVRHTLWGEDGYLVPKAGGFLFAGATVEDVGFRCKNTRRGLAGLRRMARSMVPALRYAEVASVWAGLRPGSPDGLPILGTLPGWDNVYVATGHFRNGILLGPITGRLIARLITEGGSEIPLEPFAPSRFG